MSGSLSEWQAGREAEVATDRARAFHRFYLRLRIDDQLRYYQERHTEYADRAPAGRRPADRAAVRGRRGRSRHAVDGRYGAGGLGGRGRAAGCARRRRHRLRDARRVSAAGEGLRRRRPQPRGGQARLAGRRPGHGPGNRDRPGRGRLPQRAGPVGAAGGQVGGTGYAYAPRPRRPRTSARDPRRGPARPRSRAATSATGGCVPWPGAAGPACPACCVPARPPGGRRWRG